MRVAMFTAGTIGMGHVMHGYAMHRALKRNGFKGEFALFGTPAKFAAVRDLPFAHHVIELPRAELVSPTLAPQSAIARALADWRPDLLLVDMFWAPLHFILDELDVESWLLIRMCPPVWLVGKDGVFLRPEQYRRIIATEAISHPVLTDRLEPLVVSNPEDCQPPHALKARLGVPANRELGVVVHGGILEEIEKLDPGFQHMEMRRFDGNDSNSPFPASDWLGGADHIFMAGGYNAVWEAVWLGYADRTHWQGFRRPIDHQGWRVRVARELGMKENGADRLARWIMAG